MTKLEIPKHEGMTKSEARMRIFRQSVGQRRANRFDIRHSSFVILRGVFRASSFLRARVTGTSVRPGELSVAVVPAANPELGLAMTRAGFSCRWAPRRPTSRWCGAPSVRS
jgi:hypothetical protein